MNDTKFILASQISNNDNLVDTHGCTAEVKKVEQKDNSVIVTLYSFYSRKPNGIETVTFKQNQKVKIVNFEHE